MSDTARFGRAPECRIRHGALHDSDFVARVSRQVFSLYGEYDEILPACLDDSRVHTLISEQGGRAVGFCMLWVRGRVGEVIAVAVAPPWQGRGIGGQLMHAMIDDAGKMGIRLLLLKTGVGNRRAQRLFRGMGFEATGGVEGYYAGGQAAIRMRKGIGYG